MKATTGTITASEGDESDAVVLALVVPSEVEASGFSVDVAEIG